MKQTREYEIAFSTPAFLGNANQRAQWRTPPIKTALRYWWRIVKAKSCHYSFEKLLEEEKRLFGHASDNDSQKSKVDLRLDKWRESKKTYGSLPNRFRKVGRGVDADLYLGYGPIVPGKNENKTILQNNDGATLKIQFPCQYEKEIDEASNLLAWFGTMGSRSRNGWGSLIMHGEKLKNFSEENITPYLRELEDCLQVDWPHAIGIDNGLPLLWTSSSKLGSWEEAFNHLAELKVEIRNAGKGFNNSPKLFAGIHLLGYPAGSGWELSKIGNERWPTPIRFKVVMDGDKRFYCRVCHMPTMLPERIMNDKDKLSMSERDWIKENQLKIYRKIHQTIDSQTNFKRCFS